MGYPLDKEEKAADPLAGGIANHGYQCGMLWGMTLAGGAQVYRALGAGTEAETAALTIAQKLVTSFRTCNWRKEINCMEITDLYLQKKFKMTDILKFFVSGRAIFGCFTTMAGRSAKATYRDINETLKELKIDRLSPPVSCTAEVARKSGAGELHTVMAAGLAGGIGLCGGGCGALGTAIWLNEMKNVEKEAGVKVSSKLVTARAGDIVNKFLKISDYKFECAEITGRKFESISEHTEFLRGGGCAKIIEVLSKE